MNFKIGQEVVCVDDSQPNCEGIKRWGIIFPKKDTIYTVRGIFPGGGAIWLKEVINPVAPLKQGGQGEPAFFTNRFVPLDSLFESISITELIEEPITATV